MQSHNIGVGTVILVIALVIIIVVVINRFFDVAGKYTCSDLKRRHELYLRLFKIPLLLGLIAVASWLFVPYSITTYRGGLIASVLGVGISIFAAESFKKVAEHKRVKKNLGTIKYVTIPYLESHARGITDTLKKYQDTLSVLQAFLLLTLVANYDTISVTFDKSWLELIHSQDFIDAIENDELFYQIADVEFEVLSFTKNLTDQSVRAKYLLTNWQSLIKSDKQVELLSQVSSIRDSLNKSAKTLEQYTKKLDRAADIFLMQNGAKYQDN